MRRALHSLFVLTVTLATGLPARAASLQEAADALGAANVNTLEFSGTGRWYQFGQAPIPGTAWPAFELSRYVADLNYAQASSRVRLTRKQLVEPGRLRPTPVDQRFDQYLSGALAWNLVVPDGAAPGAPLTPTPQPLAVEERAAEIWATPQGFLKAALANHAESKPAGDGVEVSFVLGGTYRYLGTVNARNQVERVQTFIDSPVLGDTLVETRFSDYQAFGGLQFPAHLTRTQGGFPVLELTVTEVKANPTVEVQPPQEVLHAKPAPVTVTKLTDGVFHLTGGTHHSVAIEQGDHLVLVEAPLNEARSLAVLAKLKEAFPGKQVTTLINTHAHFDHSGGLRTYLAEGATVVTHEANKAYYEKLSTAPHTLSPDRLATSKKAPRFTTLTDKLALPDARHPIEVHAIAGSGHNDGFVLVYLPADKILVEADAYTPLAASAPPPPSPNPYSVNLYQNIQRLQLEVNQLAPLHGPRVVTLADLRTAIGEPVGTR
jgi:glyoxylase-like metal-dependent hydrolase (beta-lactamase superfamily II)